jgi:hypothetical protein
MLVAAPKYGGRSRNWPALARFVLVIRGASKLAFDGRARLLTVRRIDEVAIEAAGHGESDLSNAAKVKAGAVRMTAGLPETPAF